MHIYQYQEELTNCESDIWQFLEEFIQETHAEKSDLDFSDHPNESDESEICEMRIEVNMDEQQYFLYSPTSPEVPGDQKPKIESANNSDLQPAFDEMSVMMNDDSDHFMSILQDREFVSMLPRQEKVLPLISQEHADPFHSDWPHWGQTSSMITLGN